MSNSICRVVLLTLLTLPAALLSASAHAIFLQADSLESDGTYSTVDLWFFSLTGVGPNTNFIQANDITPILGSDLDMIIYVDDGTFTNVFAIDNAAGSEPSIANFPVGDYIAVIANNGLAVGEFGPFHADTSLGVNTLDYEFNGPDPNNDSEIAINCVLSGNLNGGYTKRVITSDTCRTPPSIPEPSLTFLFLAMAVLTLISRRRVN